MSLKVYTLFCVILTIVSFINRIYLPTGIDYLFFVVFFIACVFLSGNMKANKDAIIVLRQIALLTIVFVVNYIVSPYHLPIYLFLFGSFVTIMPFILIYYSHKMKVEMKGIIRFTNILIKLSVLFGFIMAVESIFRDIYTDGYAIIKTDYLMGGYVTAFQSFGIMLCLANHFFTREKKYVVYAALIFVIIFLSMQLKAIAGGCIFILLYILYLRNINKALKVVLVTLTIVMGLYVFSTSSILSGKISDYKELYTTEEAMEGSARVVLYVKSVDIAKAFFPLGSGQGTFGSIPANMTKSRVYDDFDMSNVYGLGFDGPISFRMDTHWSSVLGEQGVLGFLLYLVIFLSPVLWCKKNKQLCGRERKYVCYIVYSTFLVLIIESFSLPLPNRMGFMFIYAGLCSMLTNDYFIKHCNNYESLTY